MPAWLLALFAALWEIVKPMVSPLMAAIGGAKLQRGDQAERELNATDKAAHSAAAARGWSPDDRVRYLKQRGLYRVSPEREGSK